MMSVLNCRPRGTVRRSIVGLAGALLLLAAPATASPDNLLSCSACFRWSVIAIDGGVEYSDATLALALEDMQDVPGLSSEYQLYALAAIVIFLLQAALIGALLLLRKRRARAEAALRRSEARNRAILRAIPDLMFVLSSDGVYLDYHARDHGDLFVPPEKFLGKRIRDVFPTDLATTFERQVLKASTSNAPVVLEYALPIQDSERHYEARLVRCDNDTVMSIVRDITPWHHAEEELHKAHTELAHATRLRALGAMAATIAHEVSQPISAVLLNAQACLGLLEKANPDTIVLREALMDIVSDGKRARDVMTRIRGLAKQTPLRRTQVSMNDIVDDVVGLSRRMLRERRVQLQLALTSDLPPVIGDRIQLQQILLNLVLNAADAMQAIDHHPRVLAIHSERAADSVLIQVRDSGPGISREQLDRVFEPFFTTKTEGMGMGLSISRSIAEMHGGQLRIAQNSSEGMTFELEVPTASSRQAVSVESNAETDSVPG